MVWPLAPVQGWFQGWCPPGGPDDALFGHVTDPPRTPVVYRRVASQAQISRVVNAPTDVVVPFGGYGVCHEGRGV